MRILAIDIGGLTQDILLFDTSQTIENCVKMIMPSPTYNLAVAIRKATQAGRPVFFTGTNMGGGPSKKALRAHIQAGFQAFATPEASATFDDDPEQVRKMGVQIITEDRKPLGNDLETIRTGDLNMEAFEKALRAFDVDPRIDALTIAVLDHGAAPPGVSDRVFRFQHLEETVKLRRSLFDFAYLKGEIPPHLTRMKAVAESLERDIPLLVMDTPIAAAIGALEDPVVAGHSHRLIVNAGNFHTLAFHLKGDSICGLFEHHTRLLNIDRIDNMVTRLVSGELTGKEVYEDEGHGCLVMESSDDFPFIAVTGPQRGLMNHSKLNPYFAAPYGDMMLTGCFGLVRAFARKSPEWTGEIERALQRS
ncbi:MAG: DUF1786 domain-containing protein [Dehalococcoidia bacterium]